MSSSNERREAAAEPSALGGVTPAIGMSTDHQSELRRAMWALQKGVFPMHKLVTHRYKLEDINEGFKFLEKGDPSLIRSIVVLD